MANEQNLIPLNERTQRERKEIAKKWGLELNKEFSPEEWLTEWLRST